MTRPISSRPTRGAGSVADLDVGLEAFLGRGGAGERADRLDHVTPAADDAAHVVGCRLDLELHSAAVLDYFDRNRVRIVNQFADDVIDDVARRPTGNAVDVVGGVCHSDSAA